jgi:hypothetical protein
MATKHTRTRCWKRAGVRNDAKIVKNTNRLSIDRNFSKRYDVNQTTAGPRPQR